MRAVVLAVVSLALLALAPACEKDAEPCPSFTDAASCTAAGCHFVNGGRLVADEDGCRGDGSLGFCTDVAGGATSPSTFCTPGPDPQVVVFPVIPFGVPEDWTPCSCSTLGAPLAAACIDTLFSDDACPLLKDHCAALTDPASCDQFQGTVGHNGCLWVETTIVTRTADACLAEPPVGRCIAVTLRPPDEGCSPTQPPPACTPEDAAAHPYFARIDDIPSQEKIELIRDIPCTFQPRTDFIPCWDAELEVPGCDCPCLP